jgi:hypothetical protein
MILEKIGNIMEGQDGAIWNDLLFRFNHAGKCAVYDLTKMRAGSSGELCIFTLDKTDVIMPHSNTVFFGKDFFAKDDEFPLLYTNVYNNYSKREDRRIGVCCVYRIKRNGNSFSGELVQVIEIGFADNDKLWISSEKNDVRPYGNFVADTEKGIYYGFVMRDGNRTTKYFSFNLPNFTDGEFNTQYGVKKVVLSEKDIIDSFDCDYHRFIQGACVYNGKVYSLEGFGHDKVNIPAIRIINPNTKSQEFFKPFENFESPTEPELIDFWNDICYYADNPGNLYVVKEL